MGWLGWAAWAALGLAPAERVAVVAHGDCEDPRAEELARGLHRALARRGVRVLGEQKLTARVGGPSEASLEDVDRLIARARLDLRPRGGLGRVERTLRLAQEYLLQLPASDERWARQREVATLLSWLALHRGEPEHAALELAPLLRVDPLYEPSSSHYPPAVRAIAHRARRSLDEAPRHRVTVTTTPSGQPLFLDGRPVGGSPAVLSVPEGRYRLEVRWAGRAGAPRLLSVDGDAELHVDGAVDGALVLGESICLKTPAEHRQEVSGLLGLATLLDVDVLVSVRVLSGNEAGGGQAHILALDRWAGRERREARLPAGSWQRTGEALGRLADFLETGEATAPVEPLRGARSLALEASLAPSGERERRLRSGAHAASTLAVLSGLGALAMVGQQQAASAAHFQACTGDAACASPDTRRLARAKDAWTGPALGLGAASAVALASAAWLYLASARGDSEAAREPHGL